MRQKPDLEQRHPLYQANLARWNFLRDHHAGGREYLGKGYLARHERESAENFRRRLMESRYPNFCKPINHLFASHLWRRRPRRSLPGRLAGLVRDVDRFGTDADGFFKQVTTAAGVEGHGFIMVDAPNGRLPMNLAEQDEGWFRPYFVHLLPQQVVDWEFELDDPLHFGRLKRVVVAESAEPGRGRPGVRYRVWTPEDWSVWERDERGKEAWLLDEGENPLGLIPLSLVYNLKAGRFLGESTIEDIAPLNNALYQKTSILDEAEYWAGFPQLVIFTDEEVIEIELSQSRALQFRPGDEARFIEHSGSAVESLRASIREIRQDIYRIALKQVGEPNTGAGVESAVKRRIDRSELVASLEERSQNFEEAENQAWRLAALWLGEDPEKVDIEYNHRYDLEAVSESLGRLFVDLGDKGYLDRPAVLRELARHGIVSEAGGREEA